MKKIFILTAFLCSIITSAQSLSYNDLGVLFSTDENNGTARFRAMSGAFGALGGDLSATEINPAGAAVFIKSEAVISLNSRNQTIASNYYGSNTTTDKEYTNFSQLGAVLVFQTRNSKWNNTAITFNYTLSKDYANSWMANGNSDYATFIYDSNYTDDNDATNDILYLNTSGQSFNNKTSGKNEKYTFSIASQYSDKLHLGFSATSQDISFYQNVNLQENNSDEDGNILASNQSRLSEGLATIGNGFSFSLGLISKPTDNIRLGLAYKSPTWYSLSEEFLDTDNYRYAYDYTLKTPSKITGSFAYIFAKKGLISIDYSSSNYANIKLGNETDFKNENTVFDTDLERSSELRVGTEWRIKRVSLRGGLNYKQNPYKNAVSSDHINGYSLGLGYNLGNIKIDISYEDSNHTDVYDFYSDYSEVNAAELNIDTSKFTATLVINI